MARLPHPGGDNNTWGTILNDFLVQAHNTDGSLKPISEAQVTNLVTDLAAKANVSDVFTKSDADDRYEPKGITQINAKDYGAIGDGVADDTVALQAAFADAANGVRLVIPNGTYIFTDTITLPSTGAHILGQIEADTNGTILKFAQLDGRPAFTNNSDQGLSYCNIENLQVVSTNSAGTSGVGDCFKLYGLTNNSRFSNCYIHNFPGNAFSIAKKTNSADPTACGNVVFDQVFVISCGAYAWNIDGYINAVWNMPDVNSCVGGAFYLKNGISNQASVVITGLWWEGNRAWSSLQPVKLENMNGQSVAFIGGSFQSPNGGSEAIAIVGSSTAYVTLLGVNGYGTTTNWITDSSTGAVVAAVPFGTRMTYLGTGSVTRSLAVRSTAPVFDLINDSAALNQKDWRWAFSGNNMILQLRNDDGTAGNTMLTVAPNGGVTIGGGVSGGSVYAQGVGATLNVYDTAGVSPNMRYWRWGISGNQLVLSQRNDDATNVRSVVLVNGTSGAFEVVNTLKVDQAIQKTRVAVTLAVSGTVTLSVGMGYYFDVTLQANATAIIFSGPIGSGHEIAVSIIQDATGGHTYVWPAGCKFAGGVAPNDTTANKRTTVVFSYDGANWWEVSRAVAIG